MKSNYDTGGVERVEGKVRLIMNVVNGEVRVQPLGKYLVRIEQKGKRGFEDRETFTVLNRGFEKVEATETRGNGQVCVVTENYRVVVPEGATGLDGIRVESDTGEMLCVLSNAMLSKKFLPAPSALPAVWVLGDTPRVVPPAWGALPPPENKLDDAMSGWDLENDESDAYVFFPAASGYEAFRADYLRLTGDIPLVPLYALGLWYSRYYAYSEQTALAVMERFQSARIPLDVFVVDTDWRIGASCGYGVNEELFPDMARFVRTAHERNVRVMLNDHPEPKGQRAIDPVELRYRREGLVSLLSMGVDLWWFDRNWHTHLQAPLPGLNKEVWGMRLYRDITKDFRPSQRPLLMSNVDGINNGRLDSPSHPAAHRFPVWWTGDTCAEWNYLRMGVCNGVNSGICSLLPYVHEDLGGHHGQPDAELYVRFMQFGAFAPVARIHCTTQVHRYPWEYGPEVEQIVGDFFRLRYRLLPMLYAAAYEAHRSGLPLMRRCDLEWPEFPEASDSTQYLLGDDCLVAPILEPAGVGKMAQRCVWIPPGEWQNGWTGQRHFGPAMIGVTCPLHEVPIFVRCGGVVLSSPQRQTGGEAVWPELVVDVYVPHQDQIQTRWLYEDDGISTAHEEGTFDLTKCTLSQSGMETEIAILPPTSSRLDGPKTRNWTVRLHLPVGAKVKSVRWNNRELRAGEFAVVEAGLVLEWRGEVNWSEPVVIRITCSA